MKQTGIIVLVSTLLKPVCLEVANPVFSTLVNCWFASFPIQVLKIEKVFSKEDILTFIITHPCCSDLIDCLWKPGWSEEQNKYFLYIFSAKKPVKQSHANTEFLKQKFRCVITPGGRKKTKAIWFFMTEPGILLWNLHHYQSKMECLKLEFRELFILLAFINVSLDSLN